MGIGDLRHLSVCGLCGASPRAWRADEFCALVAHGHLDRSSGEANDVGREQAVSRVPEIGKNVPCATGSVPDQASAGLQVDFGQSVRRSWFW